MTETFVIEPSSRKGKKWMVTFYNQGRKGTVHFGASGYEDFTTHKDEERKMNYLKRHKANQDWNDPHTAGFWARWALWNKPTLSESLRDIEQRYGIDIRH